MPKTKKSVATPSPSETRVGSRRQASKEALKQMQLLLGDEDTYEIPSDDDVIPVELSPPPPPPPKKKYKLSHRKSSDGNDRDVIVLKSITNTNYVPKECTLDLECEVDDLSEAQKKYKSKADLDEVEVNNALKKLSENLIVELVYNGSIQKAYSINELISRGEVSAQAPVVTPVVDPNNFQLVMDPRLGIIVGAVTKTGLPGNQNVPVPQLTTTPKSTPQKGAPSKSVPPKSMPQKSELRPKIQIAAAVKAAATLPTQNAPQTRNKAKRAISQPMMPPPPGPPIPPLAIRVTNRFSNTGQSSPVTKNNVNATRSASAVTTRNAAATKTVQVTTTATTPNKRSVIGQVRPKALVDLTGDTHPSQADMREISFNKMQGKTYPSLVVVARPYLRVKDPSSDRKELDQKVKTVLMHAPNKFTEWLIQQGLLRAEQKCPLHVNNDLKLGIYSDTTKFPFSGGYVWISDCCPQRFVSVFNGSLFEGSPNPPSVLLKLIYHWACQTNIQNVIQWVKVDNLYVKGIFTWLRAGCTVATQTHLRKLGGPGVRVECGVISLGTTNQEDNERRVKVEVLGILESTTKYIRLRAIEPTLDSERNMKKRFLKILEPLMSWVDNTSIIVCDLTVDKATLHNMGFMNVHQTTSNDFANSNRTIMEYLRRVVPRMFQNTLSLLSRPIIQQFLDELVWREWFGTTGLQAFDNILAHLSEQTRLTNHVSLILKLNKVAANPFKLWSMNVQSGSSQATPQISASTPPVKVSADVRRVGRPKKSVPLVQTPQPSTSEPLRPPKSVSPDIPEQMVPLENYYYGTMDQKTQQTTCSINVKCVYCKAMITNNLQLMAHLFKHAHNVSDDVFICRYCLTSVTTASELLEHVNKSHPSDTKFDNGFVCLICETQYMNPFILGKHMSKEHSPHELPYKCGSCDFRCSNHKQVIDHFYIKHDGSNTIQCPFCLKSTVISNSRNVYQNAHYFMQHLQKHQKKNLAKKCNKCNLWFVQKEMLKIHQEMHVSCRGKKYLVPWSAPRNGVMVPKSKIDRNPGDAEVINFSNLYYNVPSNSICKECNSLISSAKHFQQFNSCQNPNCQYSTCCANAMMTHSAKCKGLDCKLPLEKLPWSMYCVCGHQDKDGNAMSKHLALCEKKSAYPSREAAKSATVTRSMLDVLGLVRKPDETPLTETKKTEEKQNKNNETLIDDDVFEVIETNSSEKEKSNKNKVIPTNEENIISNEKIEKIDTNDDAKILEEEAKQESDQNEVTEQSDAPKEPSDTLKEPSADITEVTGDLTNEDLEKFNNLTDKTDLLPVEKTENVIEKNIANEIISDTSIAKTVTEVEDHLNHENEINSMEVDIDKELSDTVVVPMETN